MIYPSAVGAEPMAPIIRPATMEDSPAIAEIRNAAIRNSYAIWTSREASYAESEQWLAPCVDRGTALVAWIPDVAVVGFAVASPWHHYEGYARTVEDSIYLTASVRGRGLGKLLLDSLIEASRRAGDRTMIAMIETGNTASVSLHEKAGFGVVGTIASAGEKHGRILDLTLMSRLL